MAEALLSRALAGWSESGLGVGLDLSSAGTFAADGNRMVPEAMQELSSRGIDPRMFRSHALTDPMVRGADLVLTATREQRSLVLERQPLALRRTFTLLEFAGLVASSDGSAVSITGLKRDRMEAPAAVPDREALAALVRRAAGRRGSADIEEYDIVDPVGGPPAGYAATADMIEAAVADIARGLLTVGGSEPG